MIIDENDDVCNEIINSNLSDKAKIKAIQALKDKKIKEDDDNEELVICEEK